MRPFKFHLCTDVSVVDESWVDITINGDCDPGEEVKYEFVVKNTGTVSVTNIIMSDDLLDDRAVCDWSEDEKLEPADSLSCTGLYEVSLQ